MHPQSELNRLAVHKAALRRTISLHRAECVAAAIQISRPFDWIDRAVAVWRKFSPITQLAAIPIVFIAGRTLRPRSKVLRTLLRWAPAVIGAVRSWQRR